MHLISHKALRVARISATTPRHYGGWRELFTSGTHAQLPEATSVVRPPWPLTWQWFPVFSVKIIRLLSFLGMLHTVGYVSLAWCFGNEIRRLWCSLGTDSAFVNNKSLHSVVNWKQTLTGYGSLKKDRIVCLLDISCFFVCLLTFFGELAEMCSKTTSTFGISLIWSRF